MDTEVFKLRMGDQKDAGNFLLHSGALLCLRSQLFMCRLQIGENSGFLDNDNESSQLTLQDKRSNPRFRKLRPPTEIKNK